MKLSPRAAICVSSLVLLVGSCVANGSPTDVGGRVDLRLQPSLIPSAAR